MWTFSLDRDNSEWLREIPMSRLLGGQEYKVLYAEIYQFTITTDITEVDQTKDMDGNIESIYRVNDVVVKVESAKTGEKLEMHRRPITADDPEMKRYNMKMDDMLFGSTVVNDTTINVEDMAVLLCGIICREYVYLKHMMYRNRVIPYRYGGKGVIDNLIPSVSLPSQWIMNTCVAGGNDDTAKWLLDNMVTDSGIDGYTTVYYIELLIKYGKWYLFRSIEPDARQSMMDLLYKYNRADLVVYLIENNDTAVLPGTPEWDAKWDL